MASISSKLLLLHHSVPVLMVNKASTLWYLQGKVAKTHCLAAYQAIGAADLATSFINLVNPGTYNLSGGTNPTFDTNIGWTFNGTTQWKSLGINPAANATQYWSALVRFSGCTAADGFMFATLGTSSKYFGMTVRTTPIRRFYNSNNTTDSGVFVDNGVIGIAGLQGYWNGAADGGLVTWADFDCPAMQIGQANNNYWAGSIQAVAVYSTVLTATQVLAISNAMEALPSPFDPSNPAYPGPTSPGAGEFTIVWFSDSHIDDDVQPDEIVTMTDFIKDNQTRLNIQAVLFGGDMGDKAIFVPALSNLTAIPHLLAIGNHDYSTGVRAATAWNTSIPQSYYTGKSWWSGDFYEAGHSENAYLLLTIGAVDYIFITLEFFPREAVIDWADALLTTYAARKAIIITHAYEYTDNTPYSVGDDFGPTTYPEVVGEDYHLGDDIWTELLNIHDNVILIHSGHMLGMAKHVTNSAGGQPVNQILCNWQDYADWRDTVMRFMVFNPTAETVRVETFSPVNRQKVTNGANQFTLSY